TGVGPGQTEERTVTIANVGSADLVIAQAQFVPENTIDFEVVSGMPEPDTTLAPNDSFDIVVRYTPTGDFDVADVAHIFFDSNSGGVDGRQDLEIRGGVEGPRIEIEPVIVDFGALEKNAVEFRDVIVRNIGVGTLD